MRISIGHVVLTRIAAITALLAVVCQFASADGMRNPPESASVMGRIGGKIVHVDDASAATVNPANMVDIEESELMLSLTLGYASKEFQSAAGGAKDETDEPTSYLPAAFAVLPIDDLCTFGLGITFPFGRNADWGDESSFSSMSPYSSDLMVMNVNPSLAFKLGDSVSIGVGASIYYSTLEFKQTVPWSVLTGNPASASGEAVFEGDGVSYGGNFGITWKVADGHALALTYRSPFDVEYEGDFEVSNVPAEASALGITSSSDFETEFKYPTVIAAGYGIELTDRLRVEFDVEWIESSRNEEFVVDIDNNNPVANYPSSDPLVIDQSWDDNWTFGLGMDYQISDSLVGRMGYIYLESPSPTSSMIPVTSEDDQSVVSLGLGYTYEGHAIDVAYALGFINDTTVSDNETASLNGDYEYESHLFSLAYAYSF